ncbi:hypothetical protein Q5P01_003112 [Channa striata]|uniref:Ig-like domain-containing protein n=1 Tax=Channa striata TaxID=64152 RepID=A0AA88NSV4_CHASR|nr:hypothetical protein Q5P01_003112 [Channa striata]
MFVAFVILTHVFEPGLGVEVREGAGSVVLPCRTSSVPRNPIVVWSREKLSPSTVHRRQTNGDVLKDQNLLYRDRTSMETDSLTTGDFSLTLRKPVRSDSGNYSCIVTAFGNERRLEDVELQVKGQHLQTRALPQVEVDSGVESVVLLCRTTVHLREDVRVEWTKSYRKVHVYENGSDQPGEQNFIYKGRTEMKRDLLKTGDLSLTLKYPTDWDRRTFTCTVYNREGNVLMKKKVELLVRAPPQVDQVQVTTGEAADTT